MTAGSLPERRPHAPPNEAAREYFDNGRAQRTNTTLVVAQALRQDYPDLHLTIGAQGSTDVMGFAAAGRASITPMDRAADRLTLRSYQPPRTRLDGGGGALVDEVKFAKYLLDWSGREFVIVLAFGRDEVFVVRDLFVLSGSAEANDRLLLAAGAWTTELHNEIWVYESGFWQKSAELWESVQKARWEDVILDEDMKRGLIREVDTFFDGRATYEHLRVPWKRGVIFHGPPGNGKTISIKSMMNMLYRRKSPVPTLYVKTLRNVFGPERSINDIFGLARRTAPCYLVFEDLDSLITNDVRSFFLNAVDGIQRNDGIFMVGSTNYLERLDPGISKRPSRFDRKWLFPNPSREERIKYMHYWQQRLSDNENIEFPDEICPAAADITDGFSFAYIQEAMVATLLAIARETDDGKSLTNRSGEHDEDDADKDRPDLDKYILWRQLKVQIRVLRNELNVGDGKQDNSRI